MRQSPEDLALAWETCPNTAASASATAAASATADFSAKRPAAKAQAIMEQW